MSAEAAVQRYVTRRLLAVIPTLFFASVIVFLMIRMLPGDAVDLIIKSSPFMENSEEMRVEIERDLGLDRPVHEQYVRWVSGIILRGDLGKSLLRDTSVAEEIAQRLPITMEMGLFAVFFALVIAIPIGVYSATRQDTTGDYVTRSVAILMLAVPSFWLGTMIVILPAIWWGWSPPTRLVPFTSDPIGHISVFLTPAAILGASLAAVTMRMTRTMMLEVLRQDYIRTARAKGLTERLVVMRHAIRNALIPVITLIGLFVPIIIGGTVILERIFDIPGMGQLLLLAVQDRDYPVITGIFLVVGIFVILVNLVVDLSYGMLDPKIRHQK
jgi:peptide/nickel transport system permease protein